MVCLHRDWCVLPSDWKRGSVLCHFAQGLKAASEQKLSTRPLEGRVDNFKNLGRTNASAPT